MKLLIITQTIDVNDPILGFFVRWVEEFAKHCDPIHVFALNVREHHLPDNVTVHCLGKSEGKPKIVWLWRVWKLSWQLRHEYDAVFVHMNPEYVVYAGLLWRLLRKKIGLWYAHGAVNVMLRLATKLAHTVFTSTEQGFRLKSRKRTIVGQGIDTGHFTPGPGEQPNERLELVTAGRISPAKDIVTLIEACRLLKDREINFYFTIIGAPQYEDEQAYAELLKAMVNEYQLNEEVAFVGSLPQRALPDTLRTADIFISAGLTGSLDKALLEALACGIITVSCNRAYGDFVHPFGEVFYFSPGQANELSERIVALQSNGARESVLILRKRILERHSIEALTSKIIHKYEELS